MIEYAPIDELVRKIPPDARECIKQIFERRPPIMVRELIQLFEWSPFATLREPSEPPPEVIERSLTAE
jgi:hypothetical protein